MDVEMPKKSGWDVILQLKIEKSKLPVIILSVFSESFHGLSFLRNRGVLLGSFFFQPADVKF